MANGPFLPRQHAIFKTTALYFLKMTTITKQNPLRTLRIDAYVHTAQAIHRGLAVLGACEQVCGVS